QSVRRARSGSDSRGAGCGEPARDEGHAQEGGGGDDEVAGRRPRWRRGEVPRGRELFPFVVPVREEDPVLGRRADVARDGEAAPPAPRAARAGAPRAATASREPGPGARAAPTAAGPASGGR